jgi:hypothetical protein
VLPLRHSTFGWKESELPAGCGIFTQPETLYIEPAVRLLSVWRTLALALPLEKYFPA